MKRNELMNFKINKEDRLFYYSLYSLLVLLLLIIAFMFYFPVRLFVENKTMQDYFQGNSQDNSQGNGSLLFKNTKGTFLKGSSKVEFNGLGGDVSWDVDAYELLNLDTAANITMKSEYGYFDGDITMNADDFYIKNISGELTVEGFNKLVESLGSSAKVSSGFHMHDLDIRYSSGFFLYANGMLNWQGGLVKLSNGKEIALPAMSATFGRYYDGIRLSIVQQEGLLILGEIDISHGGIAHFKFMNRFGTFLPMIPKQFMTGKPDAVMFEVKQVL
jgi:hypothetical protein